jgi:hypothetical protein
VAPIIVYSTILVATNILAEAGLSFLGSGINPDQASWGTLLANAPQYYQTDVWILLFPGSPSSSRRSRSPARRRPPRRVRPARHALGRSACGRGKTSLTLSASNRLK